MLSRLVVVKIIASGLILLIGWLAVLVIYATSVVEAVAVDSFNLHNAEVAWRYTVAVWAAALAVTALWIRPAAKWLAKNKVEL